MENQKNRQQGFAVAIVLLVSVVALTAAISTAAIAALSARQVASLEKRATVAFFAAESGLNTLIPRSHLDEYSFEGYTSVSDWLAGNCATCTNAGPSTYELPNGASVSLSVESEANGIVTIRAVGEGPDGDSVRVILQDFDVLFGEVDRFTPADASLVTKTGLKTNSRFSRLVGLNDEEASWKFPASLGQARTGDYLEMYQPLDDPNLMDPRLYRVVSASESGDIVLEERTFARDATASPPDPGIRVTYTCDASLTDDPCDQAVELVPFAAGDPISYTGDPDTTDPSDPQPSLSSISAVPGSTEWIPVTNGRTFTPGTDIKIGDHTATVLGGEDGDPDYWNEADGTLWVEWTTTAASPSAITEGLPVRKNVLSAIAEDGCPTDKQFTDEKLPDGCEDQDDGVDLGDLWASTFGGISKVELRDIAEAGGNPDPELYPNWEGVDAAYYSGGDWPTSVEGLTWIDGAQTQGKNNELCGDGIVVLNTGASLEDDPDSQINLTTSDCQFSGILYVIGQVKLVGNLENFNGAIYVEGPGGLTEVEGTGDKSLYDPIAIREALEVLPPSFVFDGLFAAREDTWRLSQQ